MNFKADTMLMVQFLPFLVTAVLLADAAPSNEVSGEYYMQELLSKENITFMKIVVKFFIIC